MLQAKYTPVKVEGSWLIKSSLKPVVKLLDKVQEITFSLMPGRNQVSFKSSLEVQHTNKSKYVQYTESTRVS